MNGSPHTASFVGWSGTGKTTLLSRIVTRLSEGGADVATIKKTNHHLSHDREGSDTDRFRRSGSQNIALVGPEAGYVFLHHPVETPQLLSLFSDADYLLSEGYYLPGEPCIEVIGEKSAEEGPKRASREISAYVLSHASADTPAFVTASKKPVFDSEDLDKIISFLEELWKEK